MSSIHASNDKSPAWARKSFPLGEQRGKLNSKFAKHVIVSFLDSGAGYVEPFLEPVDPKADGASDDYTVIKHPMDLSTMLQELKDGKYSELYDVKRSFNRMFSNCFKYNSSSNDVYRKGLDFRRALYEVWYGIDDWIEAQAKPYHPSDEDVADGSSEGALHGTSDEIRMADINRSDEDTQEDNGSFVYDLPSVRRREYVSYRESSPDEDTSDEDQTEESSESEEETSEDVDFDDCSLSVGRRTYVPNLTDDEDTPTKPEQKSRARKKDGSKRDLANVNTASDLNANHKRPLDTTAGLDQMSPDAQDRAVMTERPTETDNFPFVQQQETSVDGSAKKSRLESIFQDHSQDRLQAPTQQPQTEQPQAQQPPIQEQQTAQPPREPTSGVSNQQPHQEEKPANTIPISTSDPTPTSNPLKAYLTEIITTQLATTTAQINSNANGEFTEHLKLLEQLCYNEKRENFYQIWQTKVTEKVSQMQVQDILVRGVEKEVRLALAETVTQQAREFCEQVTRRATAFQRSFGGEDGR